MTGGMLAAQGAAAPGAMSFVTPSVTQGGMLAGGGAGSTGGGMLGAGGSSGMTAAQSASFDALGAELSSPSVYQYATANVGAAAPGTGGAGGAAAAGQSASAGTPALDAIAASQPGYNATGTAGLDAVAASQPGYNAANGTALQNLETGSTLSSLGKGAANYSRMSQAMGGNQQQRPAPQGQPIFQGEQPSISSGLGDMGQSAPNQNAVLAAIARRRARGF